MENSYCELKFEFDEHSLEDPSKIDGKEIEVNGKTLLLPKNDIVDDKKNKSKTVNSQ